MKVWLNEDQVALLRRILKEAQQEPWQIQPLQNDIECEAARDLSKILE